MTSSLCPAGELQHLVVAALSEGVDSSTAVEPFELATDRRAREWEESKQLASEREAHKAIVEEERKREEEQRVKEEIARMRQEQVTAQCLLHSHLRSL